MGKSLSTGPLRRSQVLAFFQRLGPCLVSVEACASSYHWARDFVVRQRTQLINMLRSLAADFGITIARGVARATDFAKGIIEGSDVELPELAQDFLRFLSRQFIDLPNRRGWCEITIRIQARLSRNS